MAVCLYLCISELLHCSCCVPERTINMNSLGLGDRFFEAFSSRLSEMDAGLEVGDMLLFLLFCAPPPPPTYTHGYKHK